MPLASWLTSIEFVAPDLLDAYCESWTSESIKFSKDFSRSTCAVLCLSTRPKSQVGSSVAIVNSNDLSSLFA